MIKIEVDGEKGRVKGEFPFIFLRTLAALSGRKGWINKGHVEFLATAGNIRLLKECGQKIEFQDVTGSLSEIEALQSMPTQHDTIVDRKEDYSPKLPIFAHQKKGLDLARDRKAYAWLLEMGLGKTAIGIHDAGRLFMAGKLDGVIVLAPKGVHRQWAEKELPLHLDARIKTNLLVWAGKKIDPKNMSVHASMNWLFMNIDAVRTDRGWQCLIDFTLKHDNGNRLMLILDESHLIKSHNALRTKKTIELGRYVAYRRILTGTPISKNIIDAYSQFKFLDERILGHKYMTSFRSRYCVMGGWEGKQIIGQKNVEEFYELIAPHSFRLTKAEALELPPKFYVEREYEMGPETARVYREIKNTLLAELDGGLVDVPNAAAALVRMQQVLCGYVPVEKEDDQELVHFSQERIEAMMEIVRQVSGPVLIWSRFTESIRSIMKALQDEEGPDCAVSYYGATSQEDRKIAVDRFLNGSARFFVSNPAAGGTGLNLQGSGCRNVIYFSNTFDALHRWQSEDRVHRMGVAGSVTYFDLVAQKSVDRMILRNLKSKKSLSSLTLDEIRQSISQE